MLLLAAEAVTEPRLKGPEWLPDPDRWPVEMLTVPNKETETEARLTKERTHLMRF